MIDAEVPRSDVEPASPDPVAFGSERVIDLPAGTLMQALRGYLEENPRAVAHLIGFLEGRGVTTGQWHIEVTAARFVPGP